MDLRAVKKWNSRHAVMGSQSVVHIYLIGRLVDFRVSNGGL